MTEPDSIRSKMQSVANLAKSHHYDAFISYSHKADSELAKVLQVRLERWARPWFAARTAKLFRDQVSLTATPHLWTTIAESLDKSKYLILLASTDSAKSEWVPKEITYWLTEGKRDNPEELKPDQVVQDRADRLMIVLTEGEIEWRHADGDFDWAATSALHPVLRKLTWQPLWTDLRWARGMKAKQIEGDERFTEPVLKLLSPIRGKTPQELLDANDKEQKRAVSLFRRLSIGLAVGFILAMLGGWIAWTQRGVALERERYARHEQGVSLLAQSTASMRRKDYFAAKLLALKAINYRGFATSVIEEEDLLLPNSDIFTNAVHRIVSLPESNLLFAAPIGGSPGENVSSCEFDELGSKVVIHTNDGHYTLNCQDWTIERGERLPQRKNALHATVEDKSSGLSADKQRIAHLSDTAFRLTINESEGVAEWLDPMTGIVRSSVQIDSWHLNEGENEQDPVIERLAYALDSPVFLATFQNRFVHSVVALAKGEAKGIFRQTGEMSGDSSTVRTVDSCISRDGSVIALSISNTKNDAANAIQVFHLNAEGVYLNSATIIVEGGEVRNMRISHSNRLLVGSTGNAAFCWDISAARLICTFSGNDDRISCVDVSPDGQSLATLSSNLIMVWALPSPKDEIVSLNGLDPSIIDQIFGAEKPTQQLSSGMDSSLSCLSSDNMLSASWSSYWSASDIAESAHYATFNITDLRTNRSIRDLVDADAPSVDRLRFSADGDHVVLVGSGGAHVIPIARPRLSVDYKSAYSTSRPSGEGIEIRVGSGIVWKRGPHRLSSILIAQRVAPADQKAAFEWYKRRLGLPIRTTMGTQHF